MTKAELKSGMVLTLRNGKEYMVFKDCKTTNYSGDFYVNVESSEWGNLNNFNDDLTHNQYRHLDIMRIDVVGIITNLTNYANFKGNSYCIWERKEKKSLTLEEVEKLLGYPVEIVPTTPPMDESTDKPKYKVGDKVVVTNNVFFTKGSIATIVEIDKWTEDDYQPYKCEQNGDSYWLSDDDIKPYNEV